MYRHRLPPGFVLKSDKKKQEEDAKKEKISLEEFLEVEVRPAHHFGKVEEDLADDTPL